MGGHLAIGLLLLLLTIGAAPTAAGELPPSTNQYPNDGFVELYERRVFDRPRLETLPLKSAAIDPISGDLIEIRTPWIIRSRQFDDDPADAAEWHVIDLKPLFPGAEQFAQTTTLPEIELCRDPSTGGWLAVMRIFNISGPDSEPFRIVEYQPPVGDAAPEYFRHTDISAHGVPYMFDWNEDTRELVSLSDEGKLVIARLAAGWPVDPLEVTPVELDTSALEGESIALGDLLVARDEGLILIATYYRVMVYDYDPVAMTVVLAGSAAVDRNSSHQLAFDSASQTPYLLTTDEVYRIELDASNSPTVVYLDDYAGDGGSVTSFEQGGSLYVATYAGNRVAKFRVDPTELVHLGTATPAPRGAYESIMAPDGPLGEKRTYHLIGGPSNDAGIVNHGVGTNAPVVEKVFQLNYESSEYLQEVTYDPVHQRLAVAAEGNQSILHLYDVTSGTYSELYTIDPPLGAIEHHPDLRYIESMVFSQAHDLLYVSLGTDPPRIATIAVDPLTGEMELIDSFALTGSAGPLREIKRVGSGRDLFGVRSTAEDEDDLLTRVGIDATSDLPTSSDNTAIADIHQANDLFIDDGESLAVVVGNESPASESSGPSGRIAAFTLSASAPVAASGTFAVDGTAGSADGVTAFQAYYDPSVRRVGVFARATSDPEDNDRNLHLWELSEKGELDHVSGGAFEGFDALEVELSLIAPSDRRLYAATHEHLTEWVLDAAGIPTSPRSIEVDYPPSLAEPHARLAVDTARNLIHHVHRRRLRTVSGGGNALVRANRLGTLSAFSHLTEALWYAHEAGGTVTLGLYREVDGELHLAWQSGAVPITAGETTISLSVTGESGDGALLLPGTYWLAWATNAAPHAAGYVGEIGTPGDSVVFPRSGEGLPVFVPAASLRSDTAEWAMDATVASDAPTSSILRVR